MNVVHLEAKLEIYNRLNEGNRYGIAVGKLKNQLKEITGGLQPDALLELWCNGATVKSRLNLDPTTYTPWPESEPYMKFGRK